MDIAKVKAKLVEEVLGVFDEIINPLEISEQEKIMLSVEIQALVLSGYLSTVFRRKEAILTAKKQFYKIVDSMIDRFISESEEEAYERRKASVADNSKTK